MWRVGGGSQRHCVITILLCLLIEVVKLRLSVYYKSNMGSCISDPINQNSRKPAENLSNPIKYTVVSKSIDLLRAKWDREELYLLEAKVSALVSTSIPFERFLQVFPKLSSLSAQTQRKYFQLLAYEGNPEISRKQLMNALTIIKKVEESKFLAPLIYYVYTQHPKQAAMTEDQFKFFQEENKAYSNNIENFEEELEEIEIDQIDSPLQKPQENNNHHQENNRTQSNPINATNGTNNGEKRKPPSKISPLSINSSPTNTELPLTSRKRMISPEQFEKIFSGYNLQHYQILFSWSLPEEERELVTVFTREGISRKKGDKVFLLEYQWFLSWKAYAEQEYQAKIDLREDDLELNYVSYISANRRKSRDDIRVADLPSKMEPPNHRLEKGRAEKPGQIRNYILKYGRRDNQLVENLVEFHNYICVKEEVWSKMVAIYNGGPAIERIYPKIYYNVIVKVTVQSNGRFLPRSSRKIESKQRPTVSGYATGSELYHICFYKQPGKKDWKQLENISTRSEDVFNSPRTYLAFVPKQAVSTFITLYNIRQTKNQKLLRQRFGNYGTQINFSIDGVMNRAQVVEIQDENNISIQYMDVQGNVRRRSIARDDNFEKFNPENLLEESQINQLSGLDNIGNTCYMNAVIQCLIRTPCFGSYLEQENFTDNKDEPLLLEEISKIYIKSKTNNHDSISTKRFKRVFEKHCPYFEGNSQHDAQEFLLCLLQRLMDEIKSKREQYGVRSSVQINDKEDDKNANKKVVKFFSGKTEAVTTCKRCKNKGVRVQSFFTYSLSLPEQPFVQFYYHYVPFYRQQNNSCIIPILCGITLSRKVTVEEFLTQISKQRRVKENHIALYTVFNNEILNRLQYTSYHKQIGYYLHFNAKLVCYQIEHEYTPTFYDYQRRQLANKSIKIELRQRIYSEKNQQYKVIYSPFIIEVTQRMFWSDVEQDIKTILNKLENIKEKMPTETPSELITPQKGLGVSEIRVSTSIIKHANSLCESPAKNTQSLLRNTLQNSDPPLSSTGHQPFKIRVIKSDHIYENSCIFCKEDFVAQKRSFSKRTCKGCAFDNSILLFEQAEFRNICDNIIITVDWQRSIPEFEKYIKDSSYDYCLQLADSRKDVLKELLLNNFSIAEELQLRCQKENCKFDFATRTEKISIYPNILLLHLKRFTYEDNMLVKLTNSVIYPQTLQLSSEMYELYGVVSHIGSGVGGHYVSYVKVTGKWYKCDDNRVTFAITGQHINPNAYLLFYKRKDFEPSLMTLSF